MHRDLRAGKSLWRQGATGRVPTVIMKGLLKSFIVTKEGAEVILHFHCIGEIVGLPYERCHTVAVTDAVLRDTETIPLALLSLTERRLADLERRAILNATCPVAERIADMLLDIADRSGSALVPVSQEELAHSVGSTLHTVNRAFNYWSKLGVLRLVKTNHTVRTGAPFRFPEVLDADALRGAARVCINTDQPGAYVQVPRRVF